MVANDCMDDVYLLSLSLTVAIHYHNASLSASLANVLALAFVLQIHFNLCIFHHFWEIKDACDFSYPKGTEIILSFRLFTVCLCKKYGHDKQSCVVYGESELQSLDRAAKVKVY